MVIIRRLAAVYFTILLGGITVAHQAAAPAVTPGELIAPAADLRPAALTMIGAYLTQLRG